MGKYDVQQVCVNGHQITDSYYSSPEFRRKHCSTCGAETIHQCPKCNTLIKGNYEVEGVVVLGSETPVPTHCENCGKPFPWTENKKDNTRMKAAQESESSLKYDEKITVKWLLENVPVSLWVKFVGCLFFTFTLGIYASSIPTVKNILKRIPGYEVNLVLSKEAQKDMQSQINSLITSHNTRLVQLQNQLLEEEKLGGDHNLISSDRTQHQNSAQRIMDIIKKENDNFQSEIKSLKAFLD